MSSRLNVDSIKCRFDQMSLRSSVVSIRCRSNPCISLIQYFKEKMATSFEPQLKRMSRMGYNDRKANIEALIEADGYVKDATKLLRYGSVS